MTVKELIEELKKFDPDADIWYWDSDNEDTAVPHLEVDSETGVDIIITSI